MLNDSEVCQKRKYMNKLEIIFKNQNFHEKFFDSDANSDSLKNSLIFSILDSD